MQNGYSNKRQLGVFTVTSHEFTLKSSHFCRILFKRYMIFGQTSCCKLKCSMRLSKSSVSTEISSEQLQKIYNLSLMHSKQKTQKNKEKKSPVPTNHFWCFSSSSIGRNPSSSIGRNPSHGPWTPETPPTYGVLLFPCTGLHLFVHLRWFNCIIGFYDLVLAER